MFAFFMLQTRDWQVFTTKRQVVNPFGLWGRWSLSQLLPSALTARKEPQTTWEGMNVAVFQQNSIFRKGWQAGFGLWDVFRSLQLQTFGGGSGQVWINPRPASLCSQVFAGSCSLFFCPWTLRKRKKPWILTWNPH